MVPLMCFSRALRPTDDKLFARLAPANLSVAASWAILSEAMMLVGFAGLGYAGYRSTRRNRRDRRKEPHAFNLQRQSRALRQARAPLSRVRFTSIPAGRNAQIADMSGRRPWSRVSLKPPWTFRERSCLRPVDGKDEFAGPDDLSAWLFASSFRRARTGADRYSGFRAVAVGSHHFVDALDADRLGGENSYRIASSFRRRPAGRRIGRPGSSARRRCARPCWRAPPRSA